MGDQKSKTPDVSPQLLMSEAQAKCLLKAQRQEYEKKRQEEVFIIAQRKHQEVANTAAKLRKKQKEAIIAAQRTLQEEAANIAAQRKLQDEAFIATQRNFQVEAFFKARTKLQEEFLIAVKRELQEEAFKKGLQEAAARKKRQEEAVKRGQQEETAKRELQEEAASSKHQEETAKRVDQEVAATRTRAVPREDNFLHFRNLTNQRSYDIENHGAQTNVRCPHAWQGCVLLIKQADIENHVKECPFKIQDCPLAAVFGNCGWLGGITELSNHFADMHPNYLLTKVSSELFVRNIHNDNRYIWLAKLDNNFIFHMKISKNDSKVYMAIQLIGTKISAMKWLYEVHVYKKSESRRKYMYTDNCRSSIDDMDAVFSSGECAVLPMWYANTFFNNELTFKFFIKRTDDSRRSFDTNQRGRDYSEEEEDDNGWSRSVRSLTDERDIRQLPRVWVNSKLSRKIYCPTFCNE